MKLNKALNGLKQAPLSWHLHLGKIFNTVNTIKAPTPCFYANNNCTIVVYVDDLIISGPNIDEVTELKNIIKGLLYARILTPSRSTWACCLSAATMAHSC
jgi:Reverse transcriptase (RNA-dependent DNA polymerase)